MVCALAGNGLALCMLQPAAGEALHASVRRRRSFARVSHASTRRWRSPTHLSPPQAELCAPQRPPQAEPPQAELSAHQPAAGGALGAKFINFQIGPLVPSTLP